MESGGGVFEVTVEGRRVHSKKETGQHADPERVIRDIREGAAG